MIMKAPEKLYVDNEDRLTDSILYGFTEKRKEDDIEYIRTDYAEKVFLRTVNAWLAEIHRICDITDENGYRIGLEKLQASFKKYMED